MCCKFQKQTSLSPSVCRAFLGCQGEKAVNELNRSKKIISCHPSSLPLPNDMNCFVALNRSPSRLELSEALQQSGKIRDELLQLGVPQFGLLEDGHVGVGVFPKG